MNPLREFPLLEDITENDRRALGEYAREHRFDQGQEVFREGREADALLFVIEGRVRLERKGEEIGFIDSGDVLGALSLFTIGTRKCDAVAEEPTRVLSLSRENYLRMRADDPAISQRASRSPTRAASARPEARPIDLRLPGHYFAPPSRRLRCHRCT
jgi:CRP-like cAMP-binding protein